MQFCDDCGLMMRTTGDEMECTSRRYTEPKDEQLAERFVSTAEQTTDDVIESTEDVNFEGNPTADDVTCEECGHDEAWYTIKQTGSADEPPTRFFKYQYRICVNNT